MRDRERDVNLRAAMLMETSLELVVSPKTPKDALSIVIAVEWYVLDILSMTHPLEL